MNNKFLKPFGIMTLAAFTFYGCASSNDGMNDTTAMDGTTMSETTTMAGNSEDNQGVDVLVVEEQVVVPIATLSVTALPMENTVEINKMFKDIDDTEKHDAYSLLKTSPNLTTFVMLIDQAGLKEGLMRLEEKTIFAPTNEAFSKIPKDKLETLLMPENQALLSRMLQAHVLPSEVTAAQLESNTRIQMSENSYIPVERTLNGTVTRVGGAQIIVPNVEASNGRIHVIDGVILPSEDTREEGGIR